MAEENDQEEPGQESSGGKKKLLFLIIGALLLIGVSIGGTLAAIKFLAPPPAENEMAEEQASEPEEEAPPEPQPAIYYPLKPAIIVNFDARGKQRFLQAELTLMTRDNTVVEAVELHMPMIRNSLVLLFSGQVYEELQTAEGKEMLRQQALHEIQALLEQEIEQPGVEQVLFTHFVMQ